MGLPDIELPRSDFHLPEVTLERVRGYLDALEVVGSYCNHGLAFELEKLSADGEREAALVNYLNGLRHTPTSTLRVALEPVPGGIVAVAKKLIEYVFEFEDTNDGRAGERTPPTSLDATLRRVSVGQVFVNMLTALTQRHSIAVHEISVSGNPSDRVHGASYVYEDIVENRYLLEYVGGRFYLHMGFSD